MIVSLFTYGCPIYGRLLAKHMLMFESLQNRAHSLICGSRCKCTDFESIELVFKRATINYFRKCEQNVNHPLHHLIPERLIYSGHLCLPQCRTERRQRTFIPYACSLVNSLK